MRAFLWTLAVAAAVRPHGALLQQQYELELDSTEARLSPVQKVVTMLRDMQSNLQKELEEDEATYHKMSCWCNDNSYEKEEAIEAAEAKMKQLNADIEEGTAKSDQLKAEIQKLKDEIKANKDALASAQAVRDKELAEFRASDTDSSENVESLKAAITVLSKHHAGPAQSETQDKKDAFQFNNQGGASKGNDSAFLQARAKINIDSLSKLVSSHSDNDTAAKVVSALQAPSYGSQSGEILGVLKQMLEDMDADAAAAQEKEAAAAKNFAEMKEAKTEEIAAGEKMQGEKEDQLAETLKRLAEDKEDLDDTSAQHQTDIDFLNNLKDTCSTIDSDWQKREKVRNEEIKAVAETIEILTSDAAMDTFHGTFGHGQKELSEDEAAEADKNVAGAYDGAVSLLQTQMADRRARALAKVNKLAKEDPQMAMLATTVQLDAFVRVKKAINDMVEQLKVQQADEVKKNDACKANIQQNEVDAQNARNQHDDQKAQIAAYEADIERLATEIEQANKDIKAANVEMQRATNLKIQEAKDFQMSFLDQQATEKILRLALARMNKFYQNALVQEPTSFIQTTQTPPEMSKTYSPSSASSPVISMLEDLISEAKEMQAQAVSDEKDASAGYERQVGEHNNAIKALQQSIVSKNKEKADQEQALGQTKQDLAATVNELEELGKLNGELHSDCDFTLKNFDSRQDKRRAEMEGLQDALAILSGSQ